MEGFVKNAFNKKKQVAKEASHSTVLEGVEIDQLSIDGLRIKKTYGIIINGN